MLARMKADIPGRPPTRLTGMLLHDIQLGHFGVTHRGVRMEKNPFDLTLYALLLQRLRPRTIIEIGFHSGGSALWFADQLEINGVDGRVHAIDVREVPAVSHPRVSFQQGDGRRLHQHMSAEWIGRLPRPLLVIEDADHMPDTTSAVLEHFAPLMEPGEYIVVEDGIVDELPNAAEFLGGPRAAIAEFLEQHAEFEIDGDLCDHFGPNMTYNVDGWLRRR
jgi:cephalosporin hydroxylase